MTCRDRTPEFSATIKSIQSRQTNGIAKVQGNSSANSQHKEFMAIARKIGHDLANTFAKLEKLSVLARKKSLFDDRSEEIQRLTMVIKQDINVLNRNIGQLQQLSRMQRGYQSYHFQAHSNSVVVSLQSNLANMSSQFQSVLEVRTEWQNSWDSEIQNKQHVIEPKLNVINSLLLPRGNEHQNMKHQKIRREQFSHPVNVTSSLPPSVVSGNLGSVLLLDDARSGDSPDVSINMDDRDKHRYQQQLQLIDEQDSYIRSRADAMLNIEQTIVELGTIFQQLAQMVKEQEEMVQRIDDNVEDTHLNIEAAHTELVKYFQSVTSNRWLMIKSFGVLIFFFIVFVIFLV